jgi:ATP-dependent RNA helicase DDX10/DBP4
MQIFQILAKVGDKHDFSAGLLIGGKQIKDEKESIARMSIIGATIRMIRILYSVDILIATPGRLLQHMDETPTFNCDNLRILVLDEADRILDMGTLRISICMSTLVTLSL